MSAARFWVAAPHQFGPGKVHYIDPERPDRTACGKVLSAFPGKEAASGAASCQSCAKVIANRAESACRRAQYEAEAREREKQREEENAAWWDRYSAYLNTPEWRERSRLVIQRAGGICEACRKAPATQAHHLTYEHVFAEPLFELVATCKPCHDRIHALDDAARERKKAAVR